MDRRRAPAASIIPKDTFTPEPLTILDSLPKAEIHLHLEGSIRPETAVELAARHGAKIEAADVAARYRCADFAGFIEAFKWVTSYLRDPQDYALVAAGLAEELIRQNVVYAEITLSVSVMLRRMQNVEANFLAMRETMASARFSRLRTAWIFDVARQFGADAAKEVAQWAAKFERSGVVAFGMGGDELSYPASNFRSAFDLARDAGLHVVCHAGEIGGPEVVRDAVQVLGAERIGHGIAAMRDPVLLESLAMRRIVLENCISSNLITGALAKQAGKPKPEISDHPLLRFIEAGATVTLSTDDPAMFETDLLTEYSRAAQLGLSKAHLLSLAEQSFSAAFLPPLEKRRLLDEFRSAAKFAKLV